MRHRHNGRYLSRTPKGRVVSKHRPIHSQALMRQHKNMTYKQLRQRYRINPLRDDDCDGVKNKDDCRPWDKRRHMAWDIEGANEQAHKIEWMTPAEYIERTGNDPVDHPELYEKFTDIETGKVEPIEKLGEFIESEDKLVTIPYVGDEPSDHEGRHRAVAAQKLRHELIPVAVPLSESERDMIAKKWIERAFDRYNQEPEDEWRERDRQYFTNEWLPRFERGFPENYMDTENTKIYREILQEEGIERP